MKKDFKNRLVRETSPYLLQHARNPVDWYAWGEEARGRAKRENRPIFLSVGYAACHWCHVMEKESFEDEATAELMNQNFICIKVDREERPDIDAIYMSAVMAMTRHGGWPMSVFLTPDLKPFYGGTYFPPEDRMGMPSFKKVLLGVANAWKTKRQEVLKSADEFTQALVQIGDMHAHGEKADLSLIDAALVQYEQLFDKEHGGFGHAPKFFHSMDLRVCLRAVRRGKKGAPLPVVTLTLNALAAGGIYDQLGGGFHRYSTDAEWRVPHFEKMLYDNALLSQLYLEAFQYTGDSRYLQTARETLDYVLREMTAKEGAFYATQDADTDGVEGKFYVWQKAEIEAILGLEDGEKFCQLFNVTAEGNWEGHNILYRDPNRDWMKEWDWDVTKFNPWLSRCRQKLYGARETRTQPFRDEKILVSWNGLMITSMAKAYQLTGDPQYLNAAQGAASFIREQMWKIADSGSTGLLHSYKDGQPRFNAYLDDYANLVEALVVLYETDLDVDWLVWAKDLGDFIVGNFWDERSDSFFFTSRDHEKLITRTREYQDGATPSAAAMAVTALLHLGKLTENKKYLEIVERGLTGAYPMMKQHPTSAGQMLVALDAYFHPVELAITEGEEEEMLWSVARKAFLPGAILASTKSGEKMIPWVEGKKAVDGKAAAYVCQNYSCQAPTLSAPDLEKLCQTL